MSNFALKPRHLNGIWSFHKKTNGRPAAIWMTAKLQNTSKSTARTALVTGATGGIGVETCKGLTRQLPQLEHLIVHCRNIDQGNRLANTLKAIRSDLNVDVVTADLSDSRSVLDCSEHILRILSDSPLDLLVCNAGVMACPLRYATLHRPDLAQGRQKVELQYFVNHFAHALMTLSLVPSLKRDKPEMNSRVIFVSSLAVALAAARKTTPTLHEKLEENMKENEYTRFGAYADSKVAMSLFAKGLSRKVKSDGIECVSLHPGVVMTELTRHLLPAPLARMANAGEGINFGHRLMRQITGLKLPDEGAALTLELATAGAGRLQNGAMYVDLGGKQIEEKLFPLLQTDDHCDAVYNDVHALFQILYSQYSSAVKP